MTNDAKAADARSRLLDTAWQMIAERGDAGITLVDVARRAGLSRQTVYVNFGSRSGLLLAMVEHRDANSPELARLVQARPGVAPATALEGVVRAWFAYVPVVFKVARALSAAGEADADARAAIESRWQRLKAGFLAIASGLQQTGQLAPQWTPQSACDWCYHLTHIDSWQHLVIESGWTPERLAEQTIATLRATLLVQPSPAAPPSR